MSPKSMHTYAAPREKINQRSHRLAIARSGDAKRRFNWKSTSDTAITASRATADGVMGFAILAGLLPASDRLS